ncbi:YciI family protein [Aliikangiella sp. IMCC44359]|uniref:YciI family protein n=1 Tax=Aliikangiella sp. IMCC44359 TaxID=3459125 RepID=UPI00403B0D46
MQFVVTAYDFKDEEAIKRRLANRDAHLSGIKKMAEQGTFLSGGAILDSDGKMIGSSAHVTFDHRAEVEDWINSDPYTVGKVWDKVIISEAKLFPMKSSIL